jgi:hypothetical protein
MSRSTVCGIRRAGIFAATRPQQRPAAFSLEKRVPRVPYLIVYRIDITDNDRELVVLRVYHGAQPRSKYDRL